jgi:Fic family protein
MGITDFKFLDGLSPSQQQTFLNRLKVEWTYTSNALEGNTLSLGDTQFIIEQGLTLQGKSIREHNEVIGHARAIDLVYQMLDHSPLTKSAIFDLHKAIQSQVIVDIYSPIGAWKNELNGRYIQQADKLIYLNYPLPESIEHLMTLWLALFEHYQTLSTQAEALIAYTELHLAFASIHPFFDGNGRIARLLANIPLLKNGFLPLVIAKETRKDYIQTLANYQLTAPMLTQQSQILLADTPEKQAVHHFFATQYQHTQNLLDELKNAILHR